MMLNNAPSIPSGQGGQPNRIAVRLINESGKPLFQLTAQGETIALLDSASLNRWAAIGLTDRHKISCSLEGVNINGKIIRFEDPQATAELEQILNGSQPPPRPARHPAAHSPHPELALAPEYSSVGESIHVTRDGFEFHVAFRTRFGETKTEKLADALEMLQNMRIFKPHVNLQKSGIRLVVTRWDGESFLEEQGIENLEHASPEEVEAVIKHSLADLDDSEAASPQEISPRQQDHVVRIELSKKSHDIRFHLVFHRASGTVIEGPLLIRPNLSKIMAENLFRPDITLSISAMSDRVIIERLEPENGNLVKRVETYPLTTPDHARALEAALNACLRAPTQATSVPPSPPPPSPPKPQPLLEAATVTPLPPRANREKSAGPAKPPRLTVEERPTETHLRAAAMQAGAPPAPGKSSIASSASTETALGGPEGVLPPSPPRLSLQDWCADMLKSTESMPPEVLHRHVFAALKNRFQCGIRTNDHGFPCVTFDWPPKEGAPCPAELVLTPHHLLCTFAFGYVRFGPETRLFLNRLSDFIVYSHQALRGIAENDSGPAVAFVVSNEFVQFLNTGAADRAYRQQFAALLLPAKELFPHYDLVWPASNEDQLFPLVAATAKSYGLPVSNESIVLDPNAPEFIGFKKVAPHGIEFRDGDNFVRFTPVSVELNEAGFTQCFCGSAGLLGWALDHEGRICALYQKNSGFTPPSGTKLLRFLTEDDKQRESQSLNILAELAA